MHGCEERAHCKPATSSVHKVLTDRVSKHGNDGLACTPNCAKFALDFVSEWVCMCCFASRPVIRIFVLCFITRRWLRAPPCSNSIAEVEGANLIPARSPATHREPQEQENSYFSLPFSSLCSCNNSKYEHHLSSRGCLGHILCAQAGRGSLLFSPPYLRSHHSLIVYITPASNHSANMCKVGMHWAPWEKLGMGDEWGIILFFQ